MNSVKAEQHRIAQRKYRAAHKTEAATYAREHYKVARIAILARQKASRMKNPNKAKSYYQKHKAEIALKNKADYEADPETARAYRRAQYAKKKQLAQTSSK